MEAMHDAIINPDFLAMGLDGTNMMSMLWTVAMGRQAVGIEMRGDPFLGVHWNIREDFYHQLGLIDQMMLERYGEERLPRRGDGRLFRLAECFYSPDTVAGDREYWVRQIAVGHENDPEVGWVLMQVPDFKTFDPIEAGLLPEGTDPNARANSIDAARRQRHALIPLDPSNGRRLFVRNGRVLSALPELEDNHPLQRPEREASLLVVMQSLPFLQKRVSEQPGTDQGLAEGEQTLLRPRHNKDQDLAVGDETIIMPKLSIGPVAPESAKIYAFLDIQQNKTVI